MSRTDHPKQVFGSVHRTHLLFRPDFHTWPGNKLFPDLRILWSFETVQEVGTQRPVEVHLKAADDGWEKDYRVPQPAKDQSSLAGAFARFTYSGFFCERTNSWKSLRISATVGLRGSVTNWRTTVVKIFPASNTGGGTYLVVFCDRLPVIHQKHLQDLRHVELHIRSPVRIILVPSPLCATAIFPSRGSGPPGTSTPSCTSL